MPEPLRNRRNFRHHCQSLIIIFTLMIIYIRYDVNHSPKCIQVYNFLHYLKYNAENQIYPAYIMLFL